MKFYVQPTRWQATRRHGLSLLEVLLALAILATAATLLSQLVQLALRSAAVARDEPRALLACESRLQEIAAGILLPTNVENAPLPEDPDWTYSVQAQTGPFPGLLEVTVTVARQGAGTTVPPLSLSKWMIDPADTRFIASESDGSGSTDSGAGTSAATGATGNVGGTTP